MVTNPELKHWKETGKAVFAPVGMVGAVEEAHDMPQVPVVGHVTVREPVPSWYTQSVGFCPFVQFENVKVVEVVSCTAWMLDFDQSMFVVEVLPVEVEIGSFNVCVWTLAVAVRFVVVACPLIVVEARETTPPAWFTAPTIFNAPLVVVVPIAVLPTSRVELLLVVVLFAVNPPVKVCNALHVLAVEVETFDDPNAAHVVPPVAEMVVTAFPAAQADAPP